jgi:hypothetical protein
MTTGLEPSVTPLRWSFGRGALIGFVLGIPLIAITLMVLASWGLGDDTRSFRAVLRLTLIFAGAPLVLTAGGIARVAARAATHGTVRALRAGGLVGAAAGPGFVILAAIPLGELPETSLGWLWYLPAGAVPGALLGASISLAVGATGRAVPGDRALD